jgi:hypothetical protein
MTSQEVMARLFSKAVHVVANQMITIAARITPRLNIRIRRLYDHIVPPPLSEIRFATPANPLPLLIDRQAFTPDAPNLASGIEKRLEDNDWNGSWRASAFPFHHACGRKVSGSLVSVRQGDYAGR